MDICKNGIKEEEYRKYIFEQNKKIKKLEQELLVSQNEFSAVINSKGWKTLNKLRTVIPKKKNNNIIENDNPRYDSVKAYDSHYEDNIDFSKNKTDIKTIAFYLPQYHEFKENNEWWGKGFTEWTNTKKSLPRFPNHYQPRIPHKDFGYYILDNKEILKKQVKLAKEHGLYGFCFYYYWFSGKRLMEKPGDIYLNSKDIDFPFMLCWANENWTRKWDGQNEDILIKQDYTEKDHFNFIKDIKKYLLDDRYIKIDGKPAIMIYNTDEIKDLDNLIKDWRLCAKKEGIGEIFIFTKSDIFKSSERCNDFADAQFDFATNEFYYVKQPLTGLADTNNIFDYKDIYEKIIKLYDNHFTVKPFYYTCTMNWDNSPRRKDEYTTLLNYNPEYFYNWVRAIVEILRKRNDPDKRFLFVNAWNEWAEGTYLEPDEKTGYTNINTLSKAIFDMEYTNSKSKKKK